MDWININDKRPPYGERVRVKRADGTEHTAALGDNCWYFGEWGHASEYPQFDAAKTCVGPVLFWLPNASSQRADDQRHAVGRLQHEL